MSLGFRDKFILNRGMRYTKCLYRFILSNHADETIWDDGPWFILHASSIFSSGMQGVTEKEMEQICNDRLDREGANFRIRVKIESLPEDHNIYYARIVPSQVKDRERLMDI